MVTIKSRKHHKEIKIGDTGIFTCPKQKQRPQMTVEVCLNRQRRRHRGCVTCKVPQKVQRVLATAAKKERAARAAEAKPEPETIITDTKGQAMLW